MFATAEAFQDVVVRLSVLRYVITSNTRRGKHDIAIDAEDFFAGFLNLLLEWNLVNLNRTEYPNYPAIDLGDQTRGIAIQVTAENTVDKIKSTINAFYDNGLRSSYDRLIILILSRKLQYSTDFAPLKRDLCYFEIWDVDDVLAKVEYHLTLQASNPRTYSLVERLEGFTRSQLPSIVRALSISPNGKADGLLGQLEVVIGHPPRAAKPFIDSLGDLSAEESAAALQEITALYIQLKDRSYVGTRQILAHAIQYALTSDEFKRRVPEYQGQNISEQMLIFYPEATAQGMAAFWQRDFWKRIQSLQFSGWADPMEDSSYLSIKFYARELDVNLFFYLKRFLGNDIEKLRSLLVDLDFRHLE